jgi:peptidoglycan DL-endopeptidase CwlO
VKRIGARIACAVAAVGIVLSGSSVAHAAPSPSTIEAQIDKRWNELEPVIEQYNDVHNTLLKNRAQQKSLSAKLTPLQKQVDDAMAQVRGLATDAYKQGAPSALDAMIISGSPTGLTAKLTYLDQLARHQREQIAGVAKLRDQYAATKADLDVVTQSVASRDADLSKRRSAIEKEITDLQKMRIQAYGSADANDGPYRLGPCPVTYTNDKGGRAAQKACDLIGHRYVFGSEGPDTFDCSGLTKTAWASVGVHLEHYTKDQWNSTTPVNKDDLKPGDLVFYYSDVHHVSIYIGGGMVVHAPHTGDFVRMATIDRGPIAGYRRPG